MGPGMALDRKASEISDDGAHPAIWVLPAALQQLVECGDAELVDELITIFQSDTRERLETLRQFVTAVDLPNVATEAHSIKGSTIQIGANRMAAWCWQVELAAKKNIPADLPNLFD